MTQGIAVHRGQGHGLHRDVGAAGAGPGLASSRPPGMWQPVLRGRRRQPGRLGEPDGRSMRVAEDKSPRCHVNHHLLNGDLGSEPNWTPTAPPVGPNLGGGRRPVVGDGVRAGHVVCEGQLGAADRRGAAPSGSATPPRPASTTAAKAELSPPTALDYCSRGTLHDLIPDAHRVRTP